MQKKIQLKEAIYFGFNKTWNNIDYFFKISLFYFLIFIIAIGASLGIAAIILIQFFPTLLLNPKSLLSIFIIFLACLPIIFSLLVVYGLFQCELIRAGLVLYENQYLEPEVFSVDSQKLFKFIRARTWYFLKILGGLILIFPGLYFLARYYFTGYSIIEKNVSISEDESFNKKITSGIVFSTFIFIIILVLINSSPSIISNAFRILFGLKKEPITLKNIVLILITMIAYLILNYVTILAQIYAYKKLSEFENSEELLFNKKSDKQLTAD